MPALTNGGVATTTKKTNPAFVLRNVHNVTFEDRAIPALRHSKEVRVQVAQTGICGSDVHYWQKGKIGDFVLNSPIILGHESAGTIVEVGDDVKNIHVGQRVAIEPGVPCRYCDHCRAGQYNLCADTVFAATPPHDGTLARYFNVACDYVYPIPDHMTMEDGAMVEPTACAVQMAKTADLRANQTVLVFGCGPIGVMCQAIAKIYGAKKVVGVDVQQSRLDFAKSFAADQVFLPPRRDPGSKGTALEHAETTANALKQECGLNEGADVVIECSGAAPCIQMGVFAAKKGGMYVQAGMGRDSCEFPIMTACIRALTVKGSIRYTAGVYPAAVHLVASGTLDVKQLISHRFLFTQAEEAFEMVKSGGEGVFKVMIAGPEEA